MTAAGSLKTGPADLEYLFSCCATPRSAAQAGTGSHLRLVGYLSVPATPQQTGEAMTEAAIFAAGITLGAVVVVLALNLKREE